MTTLELHTGSLRMNEVAHEIADGMADQTEALRVRTFRLPGGARVIDAGVEVDGGIEAGLALAEICMGGLGSVTMSTVQIGSESHPGVLVWTDHPAISCMASQYAGWAVSVGKFFAMGSGPLRAHARVEHELFEKLGYEERADEGVLVLEGRALPTDEVAAYVAEK
ncbi:MAG: methenyltetrahydromethanopterin cyclohydrolase, partial [Gemmatimonadales bacterium]